MIDFPCQEFALHVLDKRFTGRNSAPRRLSWMAGTQSARGDLAAASCRRRRTLAELQAREREAHMNRGIALFCVVLSALCPSTVRADPFTVLPNGDVVWDTELTTHAHFACQGSI